MSSKKMCQVYEWRGFQSSISKKAGNNSHSMGFPSSEPCEKRADGLSSLAIIYLRLHLKRYPRLLRYMQQVVHYRFQQRNALLASNRFRFSFRIAGNERVGSAGSGFGVAEDLNPIVDLAFKFVFVDEAVDLQGAEEVADAFADAASRSRSHG